MTLSSAGTGTPCARMWTCVNASAAQARWMSSSVALGKSLRCPSSSRVLPVVIQGARARRSASKSWRSGTSGTPGGDADATRIRGRFGHSNDAGATRRTSRVSTIGVLVWSESHCPCPGKPGGALTSSKGSSASSDAERMRRRCTSPLPRRTASSSARSERIDPRSRLTAALASRRLPSLAARPPW